MTVLEIYLEILTNFFEILYPPLQSFKSLWKSEQHDPQKPQNLKEMLRKSPASNGWGAIFKNANFS